MKSHWQYVDDIRENKKKKKKKRKKRKKKREVRKDDNNILYFLSFSFLFLSLFSSFLDLPFLSLCRRDRKGKERESGEREERKRERKGKEREFIAVIFPCSPFLLFIFPSLLSFFLSSLSLASLTRQAWCHMSFSNIAKPSLRNGSAQPLLFVEGSVWTIPPHVCLSCLPLHATQSEFDRLFDEKARIELR